MTPESVVIDCLDTVRARAENAESAEAERVFNSIYKAIAQAIRESAVYSTPRDLDHINAFATPDRRKAFRHQLEAGTHHLFSGDGKREASQLFVVQSTDGDMWIVLANTHGNDGSLTIFRAIAERDVRLTSQVITFKFSSAQLAVYRSPVSQMPELPPDAARDLGRMFWGVLVYFNEMLSTPTYGDGVRHLTILDPRLFGL